jgi:hypothetical protein
MNLFDVGDRSYRGWRDSFEPSYSFLNRSALPRFAKPCEVLEGWFQDYPTHNQEKLSKDFRSSIDQQHLGAFFELYCYSLLHHQGFDVSVEQIIDPTKRNPIDFLVQQDSKPLFCMESTVALDSNAKITNQKKIHELQEKLNSLSSPYFQVSFEVESESSANLPIAQIRTELRHWLDTLDPESVRASWEARDYEAIPSWTWEQDGWRITFSPIPKPEGGVGTHDELIQYQLIEFQWANPRNALIKTLESKAKKYGNPNFPYIIAVDILAASAIHRDKRFILEVFLGKEILLIDPQTGESRGVTRSPLIQGRSADEDGLWFGRPARPRNKQVSAVLLVDELMPWSIAKWTPLLWHNPWAQYPLNPDLWQGPQILINRKGQIQEERDGKTGKELLKLPSDWSDE